MPVITAVRAAATPSILGLLIALPACKSAVSTPGALPEIPLPAPSDTLAPPPGSGAAGDIPPVVSYPWEPSHYRRWQADLAVLPSAEIVGEKVTVRNIRNCDYITENDYLARYHDEAFQLDDLESVYFFVSPFDQAPALAHTMLSFGLEDGRHIGVSVEVRLEEGESYSPLLGAMRQFELMYVVADERDLILLRTEHRNADLYMYRARTSRKQVRELFVDMMQRVNEIHQQPEFYDTLTNNCTTNIVEHINRLAPGRIPQDYRVLLPGYSDQLAFELGLLDTELSFAETRRRAKINEVARRHKDAADFSAKIRGR